MKNKLALIIPYRDRKEHLQMFVPTIRQQLERERIEFDIIVAEQAGDAPFNKGKISNVGFQFSMKYGWVCFHDVDLVPIANSDYSPPSAPTGLCSATSKYNYEPLDNSNLGGVVMFLPHHFNQINGYSNDYWGWGFEDNDLTNRCRVNGLSISKRPVVYDHLPESIASGADENFEANNRVFQNANINGDGLNSLDYKVLESRENADYLHILADIGLPPPNR